MDEICRIVHVKTDWARLVRAVVHGEYFLKSFDGERQGAGFFRATDTAGREVDVYLLPAEATEADAFRLHWSATASFSHPGLVRTLAFGPVRIDGAEFLCAVSEKPEDRLSEVVRTRSLNSDEARDVLESTLPALEYLHGQKYLHGDYGAHSIVACDGRAKLTTATIRPFSRSSAEDRTAFMQEIRAVGECTTRMLSEPGESRDSAVPSEFAMVVRTAAMADERWSPTAVDLLHALMGVKIDPTDENRSSTTTDEAQPIKARPPETPAIIIRKPKPYEPALIAAAALVAVIALTIYFAWPTRPAEVVQSAPTRPVYRPIATTPDPAPVSAPSKPAPSETQERARRTDEWAVVAAIYKDRRAANKRAEQLADKWSAVKPQVLPPIEGAKRYLVVLGSGLSKAEASRLRDRAASSGMPRDSYITKLSW